MDLPPDPECDFPVDNAEHALFDCAKWRVAREALGQAVGTELTPDTMVSLILQSEWIWTLIESFVTLVMKTRELDGLDGRPGRMEDGRVVRDLTKQKQKICPLRGHILIARIARKFERA